MEPSQALDPVIVIKVCGNILMVVDFLKFTATHVACNKERFP